MRSLCTPFLGGLPSLGMSELDDDAEIILCNARAIGLDFSLSSITPSDGNCWYHAVLDQIRRPDIEPLVPRRFRDMDHLQLRECVSRIFNSNLHRDMVSYYRDTAFIDEPEKWEDYCNEQPRIGMYASGIFCLFTAMLLDIKVLITSNNCDIAHPFFVLNDEPGTRNITIYIGQINEHHFQSLLPRVQGNLYRSDNYFLRSLRNTIDLNPDEVENLRLLYIVHRNRLVSEQAYAQPAVVPYSEDRYNALLELNDELEVEPADEPFVVNLRPQLSTLPDTHLHFAD